MTKDQFRERFGEEPRKEDLTLLAPKQDDPTEQLFVFFPEEAKVGVKTIKTLAERMRNEGVQRALMVVAQNMTPFAKQCLQEMQPKYVIELVRGEGTEGRGVPGDRGCAGLHWSHAAPSGWCRAGACATAGCLVRLLSPPRNEPRPGPGLARSSRMRNCWSTSRSTSWSRSTAR